ARSPARPRAGARRWSSSRRLRPLREVALEAHVELVRYRRLDQLRLHVVGPSARQLALEQLLIAGLGPLELAGERLANALELGGRIVGAAEVGEAQPLGLPGRDEVERRVPGLDVDARRRRGGDR